MISLTIININDKGIYRNFYLKSDEGKVMIKVFLLDNRSFKTDIDVLGKEQWKWLKKELGNSCAYLNIIVSGIQVLADRKDNESWGGIGNSKKKLINLLNCMGKKNTILLSGDIHKSCIKSSNGYFEFTASPLSNFLSSHKYKKQYKNSIGGYLKKHNYGFLEIHWSNNYDNIEKIIGGFNDTEANNSYNVIEIK